MDEFDLEAKLSKEGAKILQDDELPLQRYRILENCKLTVVKPYLFLTLMNEGQSGKVYRKVPKKTTVGDLKKMIKELFCNKKADISLFVTKDQIRYENVGSNDDVLVGEILSNYQTVCYLVNRHEFSICSPVMHGNKKIGKVYGTNMTPRKQSNCECMIN